MVDAILIDCLELSCDVIDFALEAAVVVRFLSDIASEKVSRALVNTESGKSYPDGFSNFYLLPHSRDGIGRVRCHRGVQHCEAIATSWCFVEERQISSDKPQGLVNRVSPARLPFL